MTTTYDVIEIGLTGLEDAFEKRIRDTKRKLWHRVFDRADQRALGKTFNFIQENDMQFPTPKRFRDVLSMYTVRHDTPRIIRTGTDEKGIPCAYWSDEPNVPTYEAKDSPGGREFLKLLTQWHLSQPETKGKRRGKTVLSTDTNAHK